MKPLGKEAAAAIGFVAVGVVISLAVVVLLREQAITKLYELREKARGKKG